MNIGFVINCYHDHGGVATWVKSLLPALAQKHTIRLGILNKPRPRPFCNGSIEVFCGVGGCRKVVWRSDVLVVWHLGKRSHLVFDKTPRPPAMSVSHQGRECSETLEAMAFQEKYSAKYAYVSPAAICSIPNHLHAKSVCLANSPDPKRLLVGSTDLKNLLGMHKDQILLSAMSRISKGKGLHLVAKAILSLGPKYRFVVSGRCDDPSYKRSLENLGVTILPPSDNSNLLFSSDMTVCGSRSEGNSYALLESLLAGVPVVSTKVGLLETYPHLARLAERTPEHFARAVVDDIEDSIGRVRRVCIARRWIEQNANFDSFVEAWENELYALSGSA